MTTIKVATWVAPQRYTTQDKVEELNRAVSATECDLFLTSQEYFGGGSLVEICKLAGRRLDDPKPTQQWLDVVIGDLAERTHKAIGVGACVTREGKATEDFLYYDSIGHLRGYHSKIALPGYDDVRTNGASQLTPEDDYNRATTPIEIPDLGLRIGTVFCWQVFFQEMWNDYARHHCNLIVHPIKFAPRAWYKKAENAAGQACIVGFTQENGSNDPASDALGWIRKLKYESEFKELPIAVTSNTWAGGEQYLALMGWVDEVTGKTNLRHIPSTADAAEVLVTEFDPALFDALPNFHRGLYGQYRDDFARIMQKTMMRKAIRIERRTRSGRVAESLIRHRIDNPPPGPLVDLMV